MFFYLINQCQIVLLVFCQTILYTFKLRVIYLVFLYNYFFNLYLIPLYIQVFHRI